MTVDISVILYRITDSALSQVNYIARLKVQLVAMRQYPFICNRRLVALQVEHP